MKLIHFIDSLGRGGAEQVLISLLPELQRQGIEVAVVVRGGQMDLAPELEAYDIVVHGLKHRHKWNLVGSARELASIAANEQADMVHAHLYFPAVTSALMRVLGFSALPTCATFHNLAYAGANQKGVKLSFRRHLARMLYRKGIDRFFGVSNAVARHYEREMTLSEVAVVPNPVDFAMVQCVRNAPVPEQDRVVLPGRIVKEKGHADFLEALSKVKEMGMFPQATIAGDGPLRTQIEVQAQELGLSEQIDFSGSLPHDEMLRTMYRASIVVVPSRFEGFGLTALEAMALGRAVVSSDAGGLPEVVGDAGLVFPASDTDALADAIAALMSDPVRRAELGQKALERARQFDLTRVAAQQISAYQDLMHSKEKKSG